MEHQEYPIQKIGKYWWCFQALSIRRSVMKKIPFGTTSQCRFTRHGLISSAVMIMFVTVSGKIHLLSMSLFIMIMVAVSTKNLADNLTQQYSELEVTSLDAAINAGYKLCSDQKNAEILLGEIYELNPDHIIRDPLDDNPGFTCAGTNYDARGRVFSLMSQSADKNRSLYCDAAISTLEDLEVYQIYGEHCDKSHVGDMLFKQSLGISIFEQKSKALV